VQCPYCGGDSQVVDSRTSSESVRRRRVCNECRRRFTTYERLATPSIKVQKRDGRTEPFSPDKLVRVLTRVGRDRPGMGPADVQRLARAIEAQLVDQAVKTIRTADILERLLTLVGDVDRMARDRLAANYLDEDGRLRTDAPAAAGRGPDQLGLFGEDEEEKP
jgi:transcriptional repressor NrdR